MSDEQLWDVLVDEEYAFSVLAHTQQAAYDVAERSWDRDHGRLDFSLHTVGVKLAALPGSES